MNGERTYPSVLIEVTSLGVGEPRDLLGQWFPKWGLRIHQHPLGTC